MLFTLSNIVSILLGCLTGFSIFITILFKKKYSKILSPTKKLISTLENENSILIQEIIKKHYMSYLKSKKDEKKDILEITKDMANDISRIFNPDSEKPLLELSIKDLLTFFDHYVNKLETTIYSLGIDGIEDLKINTIVNIVILSKKVYNILYHKNKDWKSNVRYGHLEESCVAIPKISCALFFPPRNSTLRPVPHEVYHFAPDNTYKKVLCTPACKSTIGEKKKMSVLGRVHL